MILKVKTMAGTALSECRIRKKTAKIFLTMQWRIMNSRRTEGHLGHRIMLCTRTLSLELKFETTVLWQNLLLLE